MPVPGGTTLSISTFVNRVLCSWPAVSGATGYRLRRKLQADADSELVLIYDGTDLSYTDYPLHHDYSTTGNDLREWEWNLVAYNDDGEGADSIQTYTMPGVANTDANGFELAHPTYNDGSDKTASYSDITKSGTGGASDDDINAAVLYYGQVPLQTI